jgi:membrane protease YdiL (CAAX protease family)
MTKNHAVGTRQYDLRYVWAAYVAWLGITWAEPQLYRVVDLRSINPWIIPTVRMLLMLAAAYAVLRWVEHRSFASGFHVSKQRIGAALAWAVGLAVAAYGAEWLYERVVMLPLLGGGQEASSGHEAETIQPLVARGVEYGYIVIEGVIECLIFVGFLIDRLARRWGWVAALLVGNVAFALWHFWYFRAGLLPGGVLIGLTFVLGLIISLSFVRTRNVLAPIACHLLVDSPSAISILLGRGA